MHQTRPSTLFFPYLFSCERKDRAPGTSKRPRRNESPRHARSLLSSEPVSSFSNCKRFAGLQFEIKHLTTSSKNASHREEQNHVTNQTAYALRVYGAAAAAAAADGGDHGGSAEHLQPLRLHAAGYPRDRSCRRAVGQGRRRDGKADLSLPEGRQRSGAALRSDRPAGKIRRAALRRAGLPPSAATRSARSTAANARSAAASASSIRPTSTSSATASSPSRTRPRSRPSSIRRSRRSACAGSRSA